MPASYPDILLGKLALQLKLVGGQELRECLNAQEAGRRAGVEQSLAAVLVKRGYLNRQGARELEAARDQTERGRRAKMAVQVLMRQGRPGDGILKAYYERLKADGFPVDLGAALES